MELTWFTNARMPLFHIPQCSIQNRNVHISVINGALWDTEQVHSGICEIGLLSANHLAIQNVDFILQLRTEDAHAFLYETLIQLSSV